MQCETWTHGAASVPANMRRPGGPTYLKRTRRCPNAAIGIWAERTEGRITPAGHHGLVKHLCAEHAAELKPRFWQELARCTCDECIWGVIDGHPVATNE